MYAGELKEKIMVRVKRFAVLSAACLMAGCGFIEDTQVEETKETGNGISNLNLSEVDVEETKETGNGISNLNLSEADVEEYKPESGVWRVIEYKSEEMLGTAQKYLPKMAGEYGLTFDPENACIKTLRNWYAKDHPELAVPGIPDDAVVNTETIDYPYTEIAQMPEDLHSTAHTALYDDGSISICYCSGGECIVSYPDEICNMSGREQSKFYIYDMSDFGDTFEEYDLEKDPSAADKVYKIGSREVSIKEAVETAADKLINSEIDELRTGDFGIRPVSVEIKRAASGDIGYLIYFEYSYDGIPLLGHAGYVERDFQEEENDRDYYRLHLVSGIKAGVYSDRGLDFVWTGNITSPSATVREVGPEEVMDYEKACAVVSGFLSPRHVFDVSEVVLQYGMVSLIQKENDDRIGYGRDRVGYIAPLWRFTITNPDHIGWGQMFVYVDAVNGDIILEAV
ncbi:MAG: hypothetical protein IKO30_04205 [Lachnospiraceae bacterium]|nr:hypothetical protein [Lachnospiraceae bacterium]